MRLIELAREIARRGVKRDDFGPGELRMVADAFGLELADPDQVKALETARTQLETASSEVEAMRDEVRRLKRKKLRAASDQFVNKAIAAGAILPKFAREWGRQYEIDPEGTAKLLALPDDSPAPVEVAGFEIDFLTVISQ